MNVSTTQDLAIAQRLADIHQRIASACARTSRDQFSITLVAVTKFFPIETVRKACALGLAHIGENRVQELIEKFGDGSVVRDFPETCLHLIGHLQSNKVRKAVHLAAAIDAVDSLALAEHLQREAKEIQRHIRILVEVNTSGEAQKYGINPAEALPLVEQMLPFDHLRVEGLMTIGPNVEDSEAVRKSFRLLSQTFEDIKVKLNPLEWKALSMGMSGDFEIAIEEGATEIRLGTALFGPRR